MNSSAGDLQERDAGDGYLGAGQLLHGLDGEIASLYGEKNYNAVIERFIAMSSSERKQLLHASWSRGLQAAVGR